VKFYQPHKENLDGSWTFPKAVENIIPNFRINHSVILEVYGYGWQASNTGITKSWENYKKGGETQTKKLHKKAISYLISTAMKHTSKHDTKEII